MVKIYLDKDFCCYTVENENTVQSIETDFFDGKCNAFIEGYRFVPRGQRWTDSEGFVFIGEMVAPWKPYEELDSAQRNYERTLIADYTSALKTLGVEV